MSNVDVRVETVDNRLYVSESTRTPGHTHKSYYPVEFLTMNGIIICAILGVTFILGYSIYEIWWHMRNTLR